MAKPKRWTPKESLPVPERRDPEVWHETPNSMVTVGHGYSGSDLRTIIVWIYNINQNGSANAFREQLGSYFTTDSDGNVVIKDMSVDTLSSMLADLGTAKEVMLPDLGVRLILLIFNCNQNGTGNLADLANDVD